MTFLLAVRGSTYLRVADGDWDDPLDGSYAKAKGGRWNAPGSYDVVYLSADRPTARLNVARLLAGHPYGPEDLDDTETFILIATDVPQGEYADIVTDAGCTASGLPTSYPLDAAGDPVSHDVCQPVGQAVHDQGLPGVACRSAALGASMDHEELAFFPRDGQRLTEQARWAFGDWYWSD